LSEAPIRIRGAHEHNLRRVDLDLPRGKMTVLTGVSGSGKSSLAVDTLHREGQRRLLDALGGSGGRVPRPKVELISGLPPTIAVPARPPARSRDTVGSLSECSDLLRLLFARLGTLRCPHCGQQHPHTRSDEITRALLDLEPGTRLTLLAPLARRREGALTPLLAEVRREGFARVRLDGVLQRIDDIVPSSGPHNIDLVVDRIKVGPDKQARVAEAVQTALTAGNGRLVAVTTRDVSWSTRPWCAQFDAVWDAPTPASLHRTGRAGACETCSGAGCETCDASGLREPGRLIELGGHTLASVTGRPLTGVMTWVEQLAIPDHLRSHAQELVRRLRHLEGLGLGSLNLSRSTREMSTSERHRVWLGARTATELSGVVFVLDEPADHLDDAEAAQLAAWLRGLSAGGNTLVVVDHNLAVVRAADHVVEFGPGAGPQGGRVIFAGSPEEAAKSDTPTGRALSGRVTGPAPLGGAHTEGSNGALILRSVHAPPLTLPFGALTVVTGPSGSGKSMLLERALVDAARAQLGGAEHQPAPRPGAVEGPAAASLQGPLARLLVLERGAASRSPRSCVATLTGLWTHLRDLLAATRDAKVLGFKAERFSFNRPTGRCPACDGTGTVALELGPLPPMNVTCEACGGGRFAPSTLQVRWRGLDAAALLRCTISDLRPLFSAQRGPRRILAAAERVGLGYLTLGQRSDSLSGGEHQRLQLAAALARTAERPLRAGVPPEAGALVVVDAPASGLHAEDVPPVMLALQDLCRHGAAVAAIAYHPLVIHAADYRITLPR
jgi:excinuclease ABC subunit A